MMSKGCIIEDCRRKHKGKGYCATHLARFKKHGNPNYRNKGKKIEFKVEENGCFVCVSHYKDKDGYPQIMVNGSSWRMGRFVYTEMFGDIHDGLILRHKCDNPSCINPEHLELGTIQENNLDKKERNRVTKLSGEKNPQAKITEKQAVEIKKLISNGYNSKEISEMTGITRSIVNNIRYKRAWVSSGEL